jgi:hypothetical protein
MLRPSTSPSISTPALIGSWEDGFREREGAEKVIFCTLAVRVGEGGMTNCALMEWRTWLRVVLDGAFSVSKVKDSSRSMLAVIPKRAFSFRATSVAAK